MKKFTTFRGLMMTGVVVIAMLLSSCAKTAYKKAIPADAPVVVELDAKNVGLKSNFLSHKEEIADFIESIEPENEMYAKVAKALRKSEEIGIDFMSPMYVFIDATFDNGYFLASVKSKEDVAKKFASFLEGEVEIKESGDVSWIKIDDEYVGVLTATSLLVGSSNDKSVYSSLLEQSGNDCFFSSKAGKYLRKHRGDITAMFNAEAMSNKEKRELRRSFESEVDREFRSFFNDELWDKIFGMQLVMNLKFTSGDISLNLFTNMESEYPDVAKKISKDVLKQVPNKNLVALLSFGIDGEEFYKALDEQLEKLDYNSTEVSLAIGMASEYLKSLNGTAVVSVSGKNWTNNPEFLGLLPMSYDKVKPFLRLMDVDDLPYGISIDGDKQSTSITNISNYSHGDVSSPFDLASHASSCYLYGFVDAEPIVELAQDELNGDNDSDKAQFNRSLRNALDLLNYAELKAEHLDGLSLSVVLTDDSKNSLELLLEHGMKIAKAALEYDKARNERYNSYYNNYNWEDEIEEAVEEIDWDSVLEEGAYEW